MPATAPAATPPIPPSRSRAESGSIRRSAAIYSPNLTPDRDTGLGGWSDDDFYRALRFGVAPDGSRYYPAFPYPNFTRLTRQDIVRDPRLSGDADAGQEPPPPPELRWPLNYRVLMRGWNWLFFKPGILMPDQQKSTEWNRGRYLVEGARPLRRLPYAEEHLWRRQARTGVRRRAGARHVRATARCAPRAAG